MPKQLSTAQAWRVIAAAFEQFAATGKRPRNGLADRGLCLAAILLYYRRCISLQQRHDMAAAIAAAMGERVAEDRVWLGYLTPCDQEGAGLRAMLATIYAEGK